ncbi:MAG: MarR family transcriptional regulator [Clostridia bacterium]|nr:MarR family transcriptional regulator [Clostridia bacterium]
MDLEKANDISARNTVHKMITTMRKHHHVFDKMRERTGLGRSAHRMLMILSDTGGDLSQTYLAERLEISPAAVAVTLKKMETDGYILRKTNTADSRFNTIALTEKGVNIVELSQNMFNTIDEAVFEGFNEQEMAQFNGYMDRVQANIRALEESVDTVNNKGGIST